MTLRYLLDTDTFIRVRRRRDRELAARFETLEPGDAAISVISYGELIYGAEKSLDREQTLRTLLDLVTLIPVLPLPARAGELYGVARRILEQKGIMIGSNDLWIAAHALAEGAVVVTNNLSEFNRVPGLKVENWTG